MTTVLGNLGFMLATALRIHRIAKVYNSYLSYVNLQRDLLSRPSKAKEGVSTKPLTTAVSTCLSEAGELKDD